MSFAKPLIYGGRPVQSICTDRKARFEQQNASHVAWNDAKLRIEASENLWTAIKLMGKWKYCSERRFAKFENNKRVEDDGKVRIQHSLYQKQRK